MGDFGEPVPSTLGMESQDWTKLVNWLGELPPQPQQVDTVLDLFIRNASRRPGATAICSQSVSLTYSQVDDLSHRLANHLALSGFRSEEGIILCRFQKSPWAIVSFLGIMRAGLAFTPIDPGYPTARVSQIARQTGASLILESEDDTERVPGVSSWLINESFFQSLADIGTVDTPKPVLDKLAYVYFTSGSTGEPKGVMVEHRALCTSLVAHGRRLGMNKKSRVLQATSYTFDPCLTEIFATLIYGGCICVPADMSELVESIQVLKV